MLLSFRHVANEVDDAAGLHRRHPDVGRTRERAPDLVVSNEPIPTAASMPSLEAEPQLAAPTPGDLDPGYIKEVAARLFGK